MGRSEDRDRVARSPRENPEPSLKAVTLRVYASMQSKNLSILAAGVAYFAMLSIFPGLALLVALYGLLSNPATVQSQIAELHRLIPGEAQGLLSAYLGTIVGAGSSKLGISLAISILVGLWSSRSGIVSLIQALNIAYEATETRGVVRFGAISLLMTVGAVAFAIVALALIAALPAAMAFLHLGRALAIAGTIAPWPVLIGLLIVGLAIVYRFGPCHPEAKWQLINWGSVVATFLFVAGSVGFSFYVRRFGRYNATFGSLGAVVILLTWFYLSAYAILLGACVNAAVAAVRAQAAARQDTATHRAPKQS